MMELRRPNEEALVAEAETVIKGGQSRRWRMTPGEARKTLAQHHHFLNLAYLFLAAGLLGSTGGVLAFLRMRWPATTLLMFAGLAPVVLELLSFIFTFPCIIAAALAVLIRPRSRPTARVLEGQGTK
jgi:FtsH-binding integral membrane protein